MTPTRQLDPFEIRVLGVLLEKQLTTPGSYPMTINAVIAASNQKTNRDPVTALTETEVVEALDRLRHEALAWRSEGARSEKWEHLLDRRWELDGPRKAIMALLLLRGPQTLGELKTRSERLHRFASKEEVEETLQGLASGLHPLVREHRRRPGQREDRWAHLVATEDAADTLPTPEPAAAPSDAPAQPSGPTAMERLERLEAGVEALRRSVESVESQLQQLRQRLGDEP